MHPRASTSTAYLNHYHAYKCRYEINAYMLDRWVRERGQQDKNVQRWVNCETMAVLRIFLFVPCLFLRGALLLRKKVCGMFQWFRWRKIWCGVSLIEDVTRNTNHISCCSLEVPIDAEWDRFFVYHSPTEVDTDAYLPRYLPVSSIRFSIAESKSQTMPIQRFPNRNNTRRSYLCTTTRNLHPTPHLYTKPHHIIFSRNHDATHTTARALHISTWDSPS